MSLDTPAAVLLAILFLIPGMIWKKMAQLCSPYAPTGSSDFLECLMLSCLNYLFGSVFIFLLVLFWPRDLDFGRLQTVIDHPWYIITWFFPVFILPVIGGYLTGKTFAGKKARDFLRKFGLSVLNPAPTAWDYAFARDEQYWARVELDDGSLLEGMFDSNSLASGKQDKRDLFLANAFQLSDQTGKYEALSENKGIWINGQNIRSITFFDVLAAPPLQGSASLDHVDNQEGE